MVVAGFIDFPNPVSVTDRLALRYVRQSGRFFGPVGSISRQQTPLPRGTDDFFTQAGAGALTGATALT